MDVFFGGSFLFGKIGFVCDVIRDVVDDVRVSAYFDVSQVKRVRSVFLILFGIVRRGVLEVKIESKS